MDERDDDESIVRGTGVDSSKIEAEENFEIQPKKKKTTNTRLRKNY